MQREHCTRHSVCKNHKIKIALKCYNQERLENETPSQIIHRASSLLFPPVAFLKFVVWARH